MPVSHGSPSTTFSILAVRASRLFPPTARSLLLDGQLNRSWESCQQTCTYVQRRCRQRDVVGARVVNVRSLSGRLCPDAEHAIALGRPHLAVDHDWASIQRCNESAPRCLCTTRTASPAGVSRGSQLCRRSWSAAFPTRTGGLDQIRSNEAEGSTSSGAETATLLRPLRGAVGGAEGPGALVDVDGDDHGRRCQASEGQSDRSRPATEVEEHSRRRRWWSIFQQHLGSGVEVAMAEHTAVGAQGQRRVDHGDDHLASRPTRRSAVRKSSATWRR